METLTLIFATITVVASTLTALMFRRNGRLLDEIHSEIRWSLNELA